MIGNAKFMIENGEKLRQQMIRKVALRHIFVALRWPASLNRYIKNVRKGSKRYSRKRNTWQNPNFYIMFL